MRRDRQVRWLRLLFLGALAVLGAAWTTAAAAPAAAVLLGGETTADRSVALHAFDPVTDCDTAWAAAVDGAWTDAGKWTHGVPDITKRTCIVVAGAYRVTAAADAQAASIVLGLPGIVEPTLTLHADYGISPTITAAAGFANYGTLTFETSHGSYVPTLAVPTGTLVNHGLIRPDSANALLDASLTNAADGTLAVNKSITIGLPGRTHSVAGTVTIATDQTLTVQGTWTQTGGAITNDGVFTVASGATFLHAAGTLAGTPIALPGGGTLGWTPGATGGMAFRFTGDGSLTGDIPAGDTVTLRADWGISTTVTAAAGFANSGTLTLETNHSSYVPTLAVTAGTLVNHGLIHSTRTPGIITGDLDNRSEGTLTLDGGLTLNKAGGTTTNAGTVTVADGKTLTVNGGTSQASWTQAAGTVTVTGAVSLLATDWHQEGGTVQVGGSFTVGDKAIFHQVAGSMTGTPITLTAGSTLHFPVGATGPGWHFTFSGNGSLTGDIPAGQIVTLHADYGISPTITAAAGFANYGTLTFETSHGSYVPTLAVPTGTLVNHGLIRPDSANALLDASLTNAADGTLAVNKSITIGLPGRTHSVAGTVTIATDQTLTVQGTWTQTGGAITNDGVFTVASGATFLHAAGTLAGTPIALPGGGTLGWTPGATGGMAFRFTGDGSLTGDIPAGDTVTLRADWGISTTVTAAAGFANSGTLTLETNHSSYVPTLAVTAGTLVNHGLIHSTRTPGIITGDLDNRSEGTLTLDGGLTLNKAGGTTTNAGTVTVADGKTLTVNGGTSQASWTQAAGTVTVTGAVSLLATDWHQEGGTVQVGGSFTVGDKAIFHQVAGSMTGTPITLTAGSTLHFPVGATGPGWHFTFSGNGSLTGDIPAGQIVTLHADYGISPTITAAAGFANYGTLTFETSHGSYVPTLAVPTGTLVNHGLIRPDSANALLDASLTNAADGTLAVNKSITIGLPGRTHSVAGTITIATDQTLTVQGTWTQTGGAITNDGVFTVASGATFLHAAGTLAGTPIALPGGGTLGWTPGATGGMAFRFTGDGSLTGDIPAGDTVTLRADWGISTTVTAAAGFANSGTLTLETNHSSYVPTLAVTAGTLVNHGLIHSTRTPGIITGDLDNRSEGTLTLDGGLTLNKAGGTTTNAGTVTVADGKTLTVNTTLTQTAGSITLTNAALNTPDAMVDLQGGHLQGTGTIWPALSNAATVDPGDALPGTLTVNGSYMQSSGGTLRLDLTGPAAPDADHLTVTGAATLAGTLQYVRDGFEPDAAYANTVLTAPAIAGRFEHLVGARLAIGRYIAPAYLPAEAPTAVTLFVPGLPTAAITLPSATGTTTVDVAWTTTDPAGVGISGYRLSESATAPGETDPGWLATAPAHVTISGDGSHTVHAWVKDGNGIVSDGATATTLLDTTAPTVTLALPDLTRTLGVTVTTGGADGAGSGTHAWFLSQSGTTPAANDPGWVTTRPTSFTLTAGDGIRTLHAWSKDAVGNISARATATTFLDTTAPTVTLGLPAVTAACQVPLTLAGDDGTGSGLDGWLVTESNAAPASDEAGWTAGKPATFSLCAGAQGTRTLHAWTRDKAGNVAATVATATTLLDTVKPTATLATDPTATTTQRTISVTVGGGDSGGAAASGVSRYALVEGTTAPAAGAAWTADPPTTFRLSAGNGQKTLTAFTRDGAGNVSDPATVTIALAAVDPTAVISIPAATGNPAITVGWTDTSPGRAPLTGWFLALVPTLPADPAWAGAPILTFTLLDADGPQTLHAWVKDANGAVSVAGAATTILDRANPVGGGTPKVALSTTTAVSASVPLKLTWAAATDALTGPVTYTVEYSTNAGVTWAGTVTGITATSAVIAVPPATHRFHVRATDRAGNSGAWFATTTGTQIALTQENAKPVAYKGSFARSRVSGSSGGYVKYTSSKGRTATFTATGRTFAFVSTKGKAYGKAIIYVDGRKAASLDLYAAATQAGRVVWSKTLAYGKHTIRIVVSGAKRSAATGKRVDVDAFVVIR